MFLPFPFLIPMSIAVSAIVRPSRIHRAIVVVGGLALFAQALAIGMAAPARFSLAPLVVAVLLLAGGCLLHAGLGRAKTHRIDISGTGEIRLTVQQGLWVPAVLLPGSSVWPPLMLLRFMLDGGRVQVLPVWRDSVAPGAWRALTVAVLALARPGSQDASGRGAEKIR